MKAQTIASIEILTACFAITFLYGGAARLASVFFVESIDRFDVSRKQASLPYVLAFMMRSLCGPLQGYLQQIFGMKSLVIFGNILATISIAACFFAEDILVVLILWGVVFGYCFGLGTQYLPLLLNAHFTTHRSKANGFAYAGACLGGVMMPPIMEACIEQYGLNGSFLVLAGIMAHLIPFSFLLKTDEERPKCGIRNRKVKEEYIKMEENKKAILPLLIKGDKKSHTNGTEKEATELDQKFVTKLPLVKNGDEKLHTEKEAAELDQKLVTKTCSTRETKIKKVIEKVKKKPPSIFTLKNFKIFIDPSFLIMFIMTGGTTLVTTIMWTIILDFVRDKGVAANLEIYYVMVIPLADVIGSLGSGYVIDKKILSTTVLTIICGVCTGLTLLGLLFTYNYILLMFIEFLFPIFYGSTLILQIALIHEFIEPEKRAMAMVCRAMLFAPLSLTVSPMIGYFRGEHGSYDGVMYTLTAISVFCGLIIYFVPILAKRRKTTSDNMI